MTTPRWLATVLVFAMLPLVSASAAPPDDWTFSGPFTHQNLAIYLIHGKEVVPGMKFLTLQEALEKKIAIVHETGSVNQLAVENVSTDFELFIQSGDIVKGGQQDRVLAYDMIVPPRSGRVSISSFCVEAGRWQQRTGESSREFSMSAGQLTSKALRMAVSSARQQGQVWDKVKEQQDRLGRKLNKSVADSRSPTSLQLTLEDKDLKAKVEAFVFKLERVVADRRDMIGFAATINGKLEGAEVYGSPALFFKMWPKLLRASAVTAFTEQQPGRRYELIEPDEIKTFLTQGSKGKATEADLQGRTRVTTYQGETGLYIETRDQEHKGAVIHRSYIAP